MKLQIRLLDYEITAREDENAFENKTDEIKRLLGIKETLDCTLEELEREQREEDEK